MKRKPIFLLAISTILLAVGLLIIFIFTKTSDEKSTQTKHPNSTHSSSSQIAISPSSSSNSEEVPSESEQPIATAETPSEIPIATMDISAIANGDYRSVIGTWKNADGDSIVFNSLGFADNKEFSDGIHIVSGILETRVSIKNSLTGSGIFLMIPKDVAVPAHHLSDTVDTSDMSRDRIFALQHLLTAEQAQHTGYYRVSQSATSSIPPLKNKETGVALESGEATTDYANVILGSRSWSTIESNYNRTKDLPSELLQADDGTLYRIYQNGVILSENLQQIIYIP